MLRKMLLICVRPPVDEFTLLLPYPPNAGRAIKQPPIILATPKATISRFALKVTPGTASSSPELRPFAATDDSKNPRRDIIKEVLIAARTCFMWPTRKGHLNAKRPLPVLVDGLIDPKISSPWLSHPIFHVKTADSATTRNRSGKKTTWGNRGSRCFLRILSQNLQHISEDEGRRGD